MSLYLRPNQESLIEPRNWTLSPQHGFIGGIVISSPQNFEIRNAIRDTWGRLLRPIFLLGRCDADTFVTVELEAEMCDDIVVEDFLDTYSNLTIKTAFAFKNFLKYFKASKFFIKAEDDIFLSVDNLKVLLESVPENQLIGKIVPHSNPVRSEESKWYLPRFLYPENEFPKYLYGLAFIVPGETCSIIFCAFVNEKLS